MIKIRHGVAVIAALLSAACATTAPPAPRVPPTSLEAVGIMSERFGLPNGYLDPEALPDSLALLPPPPAEGTAAKAADVEAFQQPMQAFAERQELAAVDAEIEWGILIQPFEEIIGTSLTVPSGSVTMTSG